MWLSQKNHKSWLDFTIYKVSDKFIIVHAHLPCFLRCEIFHFAKFKVVSNRLPLFSFPSN